MRRLDIMTRLICLELADGHSIVAQCADETLPEIRRAVAREERNVALTADDHLELVPTEEIRRVIALDPDMPLPPRAEVFHFVNVV